MDPSNAEVKDFSCMRFTVSFDVEISLEKYARLILRNYN